jgi:hypothetical protein
MPAPPVYLDECIDRPVAVALRHRGFDFVVYMLPTVAPRISTQAFF